VRVFLEEVLVVADTTKQATVPDPGLTRVSIDRTALFIPFTRGLTSRRGRRSRSSEHTTDGAASRRHPGAGATCGTRPGRARLDRHGGSRRRAAVPYRLGRPLVGLVPACSCRRHLHVALEYLEWFVP
jgi:hypothetical protein